MWGRTLARRLFGPRRGFADVAPSKYPDPRIAGEAFPANPQIIVIPRIRHMGHTWARWTFAGTIVFFIVAGELRPETRRQFWAREEAISMGFMPASEALRILYAQRQPWPHETDKPCFRFIREEEAAARKAAGEEEAHEEGHH